jgi:tetratricopeptide (TPR) repeat protein
LTSVSPDELDRLILSICSQEHSRKTVAVIGKVLHECEDRKLAISDREIFDRLVQLVDSGVIESFGDLSNWRRSEVRLFSADRGPLPDEMLRIREVDHWLGELRLTQLRNEISAEEAIGRVQSELQEADGEDRLTLALNLNMLLTEAGRYDEALQLIDKMIAQIPDNVKFPIAKASLYFYRLNEPDKALEAIDFALKRAFRTKFFRREVLGEKARMLLRLGRGKELEQVLEQIMALKIAPGIPDVLRQRDFVDDAPSGLISDDIVARYDEFCPKPVDDLAWGEPPKWSPVDEEHWRDPLPKKKRIVSPDDEGALGEADRWWKIHKWVRQLREGMSIDEVIDHVKARLQNADAEEQFDLEDQLYFLLKEAYRHDEVLQLIDQQIEREPGRVRPLISKASFIHWDRENPKEALTWIDLALECAHRTKLFRREVLGDKARMLLELCGRDGIDCGEELGQVLEEIMALDMYRDIPDIGKERDFVDQAPSGAIREDIVARYNKFFPKHDRVLELHRWADQMRSRMRIEDIVARVRWRLQRASAEDQPTLAHILGLFLTNAEQYDEALSWFDMVIKRDPDHVRSAIAKAMIYRDRRDPEKALEVINVALERAFRTRFYRRQALGEKARILVRLNRGEELGQVLEQIMSLEMFFDVRDTGRERDFVDCAPPGLIAEDILARYNRFCPKVED